MKSIPLIIALLLMSLSAGAEECDKSIVLTSNPTQYKCKDQPEPETLTFKKVDVHVVHPESEKWREECESDIYDAENIKYDTPLKELTRWNKAQAKCTMYQAVLLEEIRKEMEK